MRRADYCARMFTRGYRMRGRDDRVRLLHMYAHNHQSVVWRYKAIPVAVSLVHLQTGEKHILVTDGGRRVMPIFNRINAVLALSNKNLILVRRTSWSLFDSAKSEMNPWTGQLLWTAASSRRSTPSINARFLDFCQRYETTNNPDSRYRFNEDFLSPEEARESAQPLVDEEDELDEILEETNQGE